MAVKKTLTFRRNGSRSLPELVEWLLEKHMQWLGSAEVKASVADLIRLIQLARELEPAQPVAGTIKWVD